MLKEQYGYETVVMIGDGATDLEACPPAVSVAVCQCKKRLQCDYSISPFYFVFRALSLDLAGMSSGRRSRRGLRGM